MSEYIRTVRDLMQCDGKTVVLDTETNGLEWWDKHIIGVGYCCKETGDSGYIPTLTEGERSEVYDAVNSFSRETNIVMHNAKFDLHFLKMNPRKRGWQIYDTTVMIHLLDSRNPKALKDAEQRFLGTDSKRGYLDSAPARTKIWDYPLELVSAYCANDCVVTMQLAEVLFPRNREMGLEDLFFKDMKYLVTILDMETRGVKLDTNFVERSASKLEKNVDIMASQLQEACGRTFNWRSPKQLSDAIYGGLGIAKPVNPFLSADGIDHSRFADSGKYKSSCTSSFLLTEKVHHPLGELISSLREADKLRKNYLKWMELMDSNNYLHTNFNITGTRTGRLSSSKPNLQNVASNVRGRFTQSIFTGNIERTDEYNMRKAIIPNEGRAFLSVDYKQMEMRMFGILSQDPFMLSSLIAGKDVHLEIAIKVWGDCGYDANMIHREWSKTISFGLIYGMTLGSLQYKLNMTKYEAAKVTDQYWVQFPRVKPWMNEIIQSCKLSGYVKYWSGRIWREDNPLDMYKGCNALIQGGCADLLSYAAMRVDDWCVSQGNDYNLVSLIHDETMTEIPVGKVLESARQVAPIMQVPDLLGIPFATDCKIGISYGDMVKINKELALATCTEHKTLEEIYQMEVEHRAEENKSTKDELDEVSDEEDEEDEE